jgi:ERCC4-related helicase
MTETSIQAPSSSGLQAGMKVAVKAHSKLGLGEVFSVETEPVLNYKVMFPSPMVKTFYPHEIAHFVLPDGVLVQTRYGIGRVLRRDLDTDNGFFQYVVEFNGGQARRSLVETAITRVLKGMMDERNIADLSVADGRVLGFFLNAYYFRYVLPTDPRFQAICHGRIEAFPHQVQVINRVLGTYPVRFMLCDEVGLGKTIEALAILKELALQNIIYRILIVVPANLVEQWQFEMQSKFNLDSVIYDGAKVKALKIANPGLNPWTIHPVILTSLHFARRDETREALREVFFDLAIFDEAHHLRRYANAAETYRKTKNYELGEIVCGRARFVLLLTATPMQLNPFEIFSLVQLLDPTLFPKYTTFLEFKDRISHFNLVLRNLKKYPTLNVFERNYTLGMVASIIPNDDDFGSPEDIHDALNRGDARVQERVVAAIREQHLLSKIMIRNKKRNVFHGFLPKRITKIVLVKPTKDEQDVYRAIRNYITEVYQRALEEKNNATGFVMVVFQRLLASSHVALRKTIQDRVAKLRAVQMSLLTQLARLENDAVLMTEEEYEAQKAALETRIAGIDQDVPLLNDYHEKLVALKYDSKASALVDLVEELIRIEPGGKAIVFTQFIRTLYYLKQVLEAAFPGIEVGIFHGQLSREEKDIQVERFRSAQSTPFVMISTEAGGEGRNFQFCHVIVNYDLPWNPMKLEQRIGRLDRIGQDHDLLIFNFAIKDTVEENIVKILSERIFAFQEIVGELEPILVNFEDDLERAILSSRSDDDLDSSFGELGSKITEKLKSLQEHRSEMQDLILMSGGKGMVDATSLACDIGVDYYGALTKFVFSLSDIVDSAACSDANADIRAQILSRTPPGRILRPIGFHPVGDGVYSCFDEAGNEHVGTFDRELALKNERLDFLNLGHQIVESLVDYGLSIDNSKSLGVLHDSADHVCSELGIDVGAIPVGSRAFVLVCNLIDMGGVKCQRRFQCELYAIFDDSEVFPVDSSLDPSRVMEYTVGLRTLSENAPVDPPTVLESILSVLDRNGERMDAFVETLKKEWASTNEELFRKMKDREEHFYKFRIQKLEDDLVQYEAAVAEREVSEKAADKKSLVTYKTKMEKIKDHLAKERDVHEKALREIQESYKKLSITHLPFAIIAIMIEG